MDRSDILFAGVAVLFHIILIVHFALRKWLFPTAMRYGWIVYALSIPAAVVSLYLCLQDKPWTFWVAGFIYLAWAIFGYVIEYQQKIQWRNTPNWPVLLPYLLLYLATVMFY